MASNDAAASRPKRVRTGCLTCRERHLKCDEGTPDCQNCRKSQRVCKRGVRLNFIDINVEQPPVLLKVPDWKIDFQDESREIASEYAGGARRYAPFDQPPPLPPPPPPPPPPPAAVQQRNSPPTQQSILPVISAGNKSHNPLPPILPPPVPEAIHPDSGYGDSKRHYVPPPPPPPPPTSTLTAQRSMATVHKDSRNYLTNPEETLFMQVFVEEVGIWMDSLDSLKHFSRLLPPQALGEPMLIDAFLACGARHLSLVNPAYHEDKALNYYDSATRSLLNCLQDQRRSAKDLELCATTAIILNVYEIMSERPLQRMNHIAGARALLKECGWNATTPGVGGACFWLNVTMELLSCLRFNWAVAWHPDEWGVDMDFTRQCEPGREELWAHRITYILAKIACYKAAIIRQRNEATSDQMYDQARKQYEEWRRLRDMCISWDEHIPVTMQPTAFIYPYQTSSKSNFPEVWLLKRCALIARLFFHTAMVVLAQINPYQTEEMRGMALEHAHLACGISAHLKDRGVASVALRSLATCAEVLTVRREQEEVLEIFTRITKETGWKINFVYAELKAKWGWETPQPAPQPASLLESSRLLVEAPSQRFATQFPQQQQQQQSSARRLPPVNPLAAASDLQTLSHSHPYHPHYAAPQQERHPYM